MNETDFASYADDNTPYRTANTIDEVIQSLEHDSMMLFQWFSDNQMKANISKCHLLVNKKDEVTIRIGDTEIKNSEYEKLLGIKVDTKLNFNEHLNDIISKASCKVNVMSRVMPYMSLSKKKKLVSSFFNSQFNYCPLIWMFHSRIINNKINRLHERCLRLLYGDKLSSFEKLLEQDKSVTIHTRNLQILATEMFKVYRNIFPSIFSKIFHRRDKNYSLRINTDYAMPNVRSIFHGSENILYLGTRIWEIVPLEFKKLTSMVAFKKSIKEWKPENCPCRPCKKYVPNLGFITVTS